MPKGSKCMFAPRTELRQKMRACVHVRWQKEFYPLLFQPPPPSLGLCAVCPSVHRHDRIGALIYRRPTAVQSCLPYDLGPYLLLLIDA